jgi:V/A-type H+-transporting ATPase subunit E
MEKQIEELTDRLYREGVEKGNAQADVIIAEAKQTAGKLVADAKAQADALLADARKEVEELRRTTQSELKLYAGQAVDAVKASLADCITDTINREAVREALADPDFFRQVILRLVEGWSQREELVIGTDDAEGLRAYFAAKARKLLAGGVTIQQVNGQKHTVTVSPADGSYKVLFGEGEVEELLREFLRPTLAELLYK